MTIKTRISLYLIHSFQYSQGQTNVEVISRSWISLGRTE